jgi:hypothetical protein
MVLKDLKKGTTLSIGTSPDLKCISNKKIREVSRFRINRISS